MNGQHAIETLPEVVPTDRAGLSEHLAKHYGMRYGALVTSGSAAIELSLHHLGLSPGDRVLLPNNCCHQVPAALVRFGAIPVLVEVGQDLLLTPRRVAHAMHEDIRAIIAVHQYGLPCSVSGLRELVGSDVSIIEDAALCWRLQAGGVDLGKKSDIVVTSFGEGKPVDIGAGGGAFANDASIQEHIDTWTPGQRQRSHPVLPYALSHHAFPAFSDALIEANTVTERRWNGIPTLLRLLEYSGLHTWQPAQNDRPSWQYIPVQVDSQAAFKRLRFSPLAEALGVCAPHPVPLQELPMLREKTLCVPPLASSSSPTFWLLLDTDLSIDKPDQVAQWAASIH